MIPNTSFEKMQLHPGLFAVKDKSRDRVIGFVNLHPWDQHWFWFTGGKGQISEGLYENVDLAVADLIRTYSIYRMDLTAHKAGIDKDPKLVLK